MLINSWVTITSSFFFNKSVEDGKRRALGGARPGGDVQGGFIFYFKGDMNLIIISAAMLVKVYKHDMC